MLELLCNVQLLSQVQCFALFCFVFVFFSPHPYKAHYNKQVAPICGPTSGKLLSMTSYRKPWPGLRRLLCSELSEWLMTCGICTGRWFGLFQIFIISSFFAQNAFSDLHQKNFKYHRCFMGVREQWGESWKLRPAWHLSAWNKIQYMAVLIRK